MQLNSFSIDNKAVILKVVANPNLDSNEKDTVESKVTSKSEPLPEFHEAVAQLPTVFCSVMELDPTWKEGLIIDKVSISRTKQGTRSVVLSGTKQLECRSEFLHPVATPCVQIDHASDGESGAVAIPAPLAEAVARAIEEAERYMNGERAQGEINFNEAKAALNATAKQGKDKTSDMFAGANA